MLRLGCRRRPTRAHPQRLKVVVLVNDGDDFVRDGCGNAVNHVHDAVRGTLVRFDQTSTVHRDNLRRKRTFSYRLLATIREAVCQVTRCVTDPVTVVMDVDREVQVHGCKGGSMF